MMERRKIQKKEKSIIKKGFLKEKSIRLRYKFNKIKTRNEIKNKKKTVIIKLILG